MPESKAKPCTMQIPKSWERWAQRRDPLKRETGFAHLRELISDWIREAETPEYSANGRASVPFPIPRKRRPIPKRKPQPKSPMRFSIRRKPGNTAWSISAEQKDNMLFHQRHGREIIVDMCEADNTLVRSENLRRLEMHRRANEDGRPGFYWLVTGVVF